MANRLCSEWEHDKRTEDEHSVYTDKNFYGRPQDFPDYPLTYVERVRDRERQKKGIDIIAFYLGMKIFIDEKAAIAYARKLLLTFAFEILSGATDTIGWFLNDNLATTHYMLFWVRASIDDKTKMLAGHFGNCEAMLIDKKKLRNVVLELIGMTADELYQKAKECKHNTPSGCIRLSSGIYLKSSPEYHESPVNLVVDKGILSQLAEWSGHIVHMPELLE